MGELVSFPIKSSLDINKQEKEISDMLLRLLHDDETYLTSKAHNGMIAAMLRDVVDLCGVRKQDLLLQDFVIVSDINVTGTSELSITYRFEPILRNE